MVDRPPYRADHVGSYLRPPRLIAAREAFFAGKLEAEALRAVEDSCIAEVVRAQENVGLRGITDGEFRRTYFHVDFLEKLAGVTVSYGEFVAKFRKDDGTEVGFKPPTMHVEGPVRHAEPIQGADFDFLKAQTQQTPKVCIPAPSMLHFRGGRQAISGTVYPDLEEFYDDLTAAYRAEIADLAARGCRYLQFDDTNLAYLCDPAIRESTKSARRRSRRVDAALLPAGQRFHCATSPGTWRSRSISAAAISRAPGWRRAAMSRSPKSCSMKWRSTVSSSNMTTSAPAISRRCVSRPRAR